MNIALGIEYAGTDYAGWQKQHNLKTIQGELEKALSSIANETISVQCAGRTDRGVHALYQVVHFATAAKRKVEAFMLGTNTLLPKDIKVHFAQEVPADFHARFSATKRHYRYIIYQNSCSSAILAHKLTWVKQPLDVKRMQEAGNMLLGKHDFSAFRASDCQAKSPLRHIQALKVQQSGCFVMIDIVANAFLHHMIRNIMGVLIPIGQRKVPVNHAKNVLLSKHRSHAGITEKPDGLYLVDVTYPAHYNLPDASLRFPRFPMI